MNIDIKEVKKILKIMKANDLVELSVSQGEESLSLRKKEGDPLREISLRSPEITTDHTQVAENPDKTKQKKDSHQEICSPMVATFYSSPSPEDLPFVHKGKRFEKGQTLCILEAMKLMNEFKSEFSGTIVDILVKNGEPVEYGQPLFLVEK